MTTADINLSKKAFGPDVGDIKCKTTRHRPTPVVINMIEIFDGLLQVHHEVTLSVNSI